MDGLGLIGLLGLLLGQGSSAPARGGSASRPAPRVPPAGIPASTRPLPPAPWPCVVPTGLPPFPGKGWEYDEPPPIVVQQRAGQIVSQLWTEGSGACRIEQTAGRWIAYRAELVKSGKKGVVAYRLAATKAPAQRPPAAVEMPSLVVRSPGFVPTSTPPAPGTTRIAVPGGSIDVRNAPAPSALALPTLRKGMGLKPHPPLADVRVLQQKLGIVDDGRFGPATFAAVQTYQRRNGLSPDGVVGPNTWTSLFGVRA
jgi:peptidoglycan hydrolase-like protein with peptidoglycan-binding domain